MVIILLLCLSNHYVDDVQTLSDSHIATLQQVLIACDNTSYAGA